MLRKCLGVAVTDRETIKKILDDLNGSKYKRTLLSAIGGHEEYSVRGYNESGKLIFSIGIANEQTVSRYRFLLGRMHRRQIKFVFVSKHSG